MARLYISATYDDLVEHRQAVAETLRKMGHVAVCMEDYVASDRRPLSRCLDDVRESDALILIVGWRSGYGPPGQEKAITHLEYSEAVACEVNILPFLVSPAAPWPEASRDHLKTTTQFREEIRERHMVGFFETPTHLALQVSVAVRAWEVETGQAEPPSVLEDLKFPEELDVHNYQPGEKLTLRFRQYWMAVTFQGLFMFVWFSGLSIALKSMTNSVDSLHLAVVFLWPCVVIGGLWWSFTRRSITFDLSQRLITIRQPGMWGKGKPAVDELKLVAIEGVNQWSCALRYGLYELARSRGYSSREAATSVLRPFATSLNYKLGMHRLNEQQIALAPRLTVISALRALFMIQLPKTLSGALWQIAYLVCIALVFVGATTLISEILPLDLGFADSAWVDAAVNIFLKPETVILVLAMNVMAPIFIMILLISFFWEHAKQANGLEKDVEWRGPAW